MSGANVRNVRNPFLIWFFCLKISFEKIFISSEIGAAKPSREFFDAAFAKIDAFSRERAIIIGDSLTSDILGGINAGIKTCLYSDKENITGAIIPDYKIKSLGELPNLLEKL